VELPSSGIPTGGMPGGSWETTSPLFALTLGIGVRVGVIVAVGREVAVGVVVGVRVCVGAAVCVCACTMSAVAVICSADGPQAVNNRMIKMARYESFMAILLFLISSIAWFPEKNCQNPSYLRGQNLN
jgi:hypothetical protein